ncbi:MerR family transcriptional regulator [Brachyspira aalborgi]|jgi:DNA-binding transcriptional MerR regulator|uniref:MerR family transcriptional regulator n=1 Tax=Brachyspira aalborgi TaxID=29522 RepID=A0A5C8FV28_9SPIR|nr:MerR family transcriptional regulator [Brachyspira aalborgi]MBS4763600.1 MerR family transcriptional regulator [Brachyspira sp.]CCY78761.1 transcriptional regulator MerR family [Brachyspira sp. CAG:700]TXJ15920.1 MerR family transcriptional regulator [Brachyspira aalborgi]TXJ19420.1 MerR family transcriptional regulator [Brachyspira aalborgi]TXJ30656.1 MerR family transcriptional regulator [Brachyspira aalborgi]
MTIAEVSKKVNLSADTLRYYERIGLIPEVNRTESGIRNYTEEDLGWIEFSKCMRNAGMSIEALIEYIKLYKKGDVTLEARKQLLISQKDVIKERLEEIQNTFDRINYKIKNYEKLLVEREKDLLKKKNKK